jgi:Pyridoxamine 5'-phosphate oxidase
MAQNLGLPHSLRTPQASDMADSVAPDLQPSALTLLDSASLAMIERGVPTMVASCDEKLRPSVSMAVGCVLDAEAGELTVFVSRRSAPRLLENIASHGRIAVVCVEPRSHRAVQLKSHAVRIRPANAADAAALVRYLSSVEEELLQVGHSREFTRCIMTQRESELVALTFVPDQAFNQAPGPHAGVALSG